MRFENRSVSYEGLPENETVLLEMKLGLERNGKEGVSVERRDEKEQDDEPFPEETPREVRRREDRVGSLPSWQPVRSKEEAWSAGETKGGGGDEEKTRTSTIFVTSDSSDDLKSHSPSWLAALSHS